MFDVYMNSFTGEIIVAILSQHGIHCQCCLRSCDQLTCYLGLNNSRISFQKKRFVYASIYRSVNMNLIFAKSNVDLEQACRRAGGWVEAEQGRQASR